MTGLDLANIIIFVIAVALLVVLLVWLDRQ